MDLKAPKVTLTYKGFFSLKGLYALLAETLVQKGWQPDAESDPLEYMERYYYHLVKPTGVYDWYAEWRVKKDWDMKHFTLYLTLSYRLLQAREEERLQQGRKIKGVNGELTLTIESKAVFDDTVFDKHWLTRMYKHIILNRHIGRYLGMAKDDAWDEAKSLRDTAAGYLQTLLSQPEGFHQPGESPFGV